MSDSTHPSPAKRSRAAIMGLLARSLPQELSQPLAAHWPGLEVRVFRAPETGLVMLRGRMGGDGAPFNTGEATMSRAVIELATGERGYGQLFGSNKAHAHDAAIVEALAQRPADGEKVEALILAPVARRLAEDKQRQRSETAATKVDFFTLVRAEG
jgi:alpha-D-ribose 1-methylphosphonate 5-triphosphate synthase subunit PhnG